MKNVFEIKNIDEYKEYYSKLQADDFDHINMNFTIEDMNKIEELAKLNNCSVSCYITWLLLESHRDEKI